jgi:DNA-binding NtrC family response regulator
MIDILLIEDDRVLGGALAQRLRLEGFAVRWAETCAQAMDALRLRRPGFVVSDIRLPDGSGEDLYRSAMPYLGDTPILFVTAFADIGQAVRLVRAGADDYLTKPYDVDALVARVRALAHDPPVHDAPAGAEAVFGASQATAGLERDLQRLATRDLAVLLRGETGVGKEVAARHIHALSPRAAQPFVAVNCGAIARELMESQFFGHERGAFTGATTAHAGYFEEVGEGTLFLDEIGELDARLQTALLRVLQDGGFRRLGGRGDLRFKGRLVAATNADLQTRIAQREFREDLYFRLAVVELTIPPLRQRRDEIAPLATRFLREAAGRNGMPGLRLDEAALAALLVHSWPGNVRELRNRIERAAALVEGERVTPSDLFPEQRLDAVAPVTLADARDLAEFDQIEHALALSGGRVSEAARRLGISRTTLWKRRRKQIDGENGSPTGDSS